MGLGILLHAVNQQDSRTLPSRLWVLTVWSPCIYMQRMLLLLHNITRSVSVSRYGVAYPPIRQYQGSRYGVQSGVPIWGPYPEGVRLGGPFGGPDLGSLLGVQIRGPFWGVTLA